MDTMNNLKHHNEATSPYHSGLPHLEAFPGRQTATGSERFRLFVFEVSPAQLFTIAEMCTGRLCQNQENPKLLPSAQT